MANVGCKSGMAFCKVCKKSIQFHVSGYGKHARKCPHCGSLLMLNNPKPKEYERDPRKVNMKALDKKLAKLNPEVRARLLGELEERKKSFEDDEKKANKQDLTGKKIDDFMPPAVKKAIDALIAKGIKPEDLDKPEVIEEYERQLTAAYKAENKEEKKNDTPVAD